MVKKLLNELWNLHKLWVHCVSELPKIGLSRLSWTDFDKKFNFRDVLQFTPVLEIGGIALPKPPSAKFAECQSDVEDTGSSYFFAILNPI